MKRRLLLGAAVKRVRIGRRRRRGGAHAASPLELALAPALVDGRWHVPDRFNFARDVVEVLAGDPKRRGTMFLGPDGVIEPRTFLQLAEGGAGWASLLRERGVKPGDRVVVLEGPTVDWVEIVLGCLKTGAVTVPGPAGLSEHDLATRVSRSGAQLVVAARKAEAAIALATERPAVLYVDEGRELAKDAPDEAPTHDTSARDHDAPLLCPTPSDRTNPLCECSKADYVSISRRRRDPLSRRTTDSLAIPRGPATQRLRAPTR